MTTRWMVVLVGLVLVSACTQVSQSGVRASNLARKSVYDTAEKTKQWMRYNPPPTTPQAPQSGYCYKVVSDVVCYDRPQPHITSKLVAAQGDAFAPASYRDAGAESSAPVPQVVSIQTPFYVKEAPYIRSDGVEVSSSKIITQSGASGSRIESSSGSSKAETMIHSGNPQPLMPRF